MLQKSLGKSLQDQMIMAELLEASQSILQSRKFKESARSIFNSCKKVTGATAGYVALLSADGSDNEVLFLDSGGVACTVDQSLPMPIRGLRAEAYHTGKVVYDNDFSTSKWMQFLPHGHSRLDNVLFAPLMIDKDGVGLLGLANKPTDFTENDVQVVTTLAQFASINLLNARNIEALEESEKRFSSVLQTANDAIITINENGEITFWNKAAEVLFEYKTDEIIGKPCSILMPEEFRKDHENGLSKAIKTGKTILAGQTLELSGLRKNGDIVPVELSLAKWTDKSGVFFTGILRDITVRKEARQKLHQQNAKIKSLAKFPDENTNPVLRVNKDGTIVYGNPASLPLLAEWGCEVGSILPDKMFAQVKKSYSSKTIRRIEVDYKERIFFFSITPIADYEYLNLYGYDITDRKQAEKALRESEELFRIIFATSPDAININSMKDGRFVKINEGFTELTGFTKENVIGKTAPDINIWYDLKDRARLYALLEEEGYVNNFETSFRLKDGRIIPGLVSAKVLNLNNEPHILAVTRDISDHKEAERLREERSRELEKRVAERTAALAVVNEDLRFQIKERKQAESALTESEEKYSILVEASLTGVNISLEGKLAFVNEEFAKIFGYPRNELLGMDTLLLVHPDDRAIVKKIRTKRLQGDEVPSEYEIRGLRKNGEIIWVARRNTLISYEGKPAILGNVIDITERKNMEEALMRSENELRFLSSQLLSAEERERKRIAHELHDGIGQALTAIKFSVENTLRSLSEQQIDFDDSSMRTTVPLIQKTIEEVRSIIMDLRPSTLDDLGILATISWFCREFAQIYSTIRVEKEIDIKEEEVPFSLRTVIFRIVQEGLNNAAKHSRTDHISLLLRKMDNKIMLLIEDKGVGFDVEHVLSLRSESQGFGLASMRERTLLSGGVFSLITAPGEGTSICAMWSLESIE
jgi:PAS domain S-box-containing protein